MHTRLTHLVLRGDKAATRPLRPVPLYLVSEGGHSARTNQQEGDLVHERPSKEPSRAHLKCDLCPHELLRVTLLPNCLDQVLLRVATVTSLDGQDAEETQLVHQPLRSLAASEKAVSNDDPATSTEGLAKPQCDSSTLSHLIPVLLQHLRSLAFRDLRHKHDTRIAADQRLQLNAILARLPWLVSHVDFAASPPENHRLVAAQEVASIPRVLPLIHA